MSLSSSLHKVMFRLLFPALCLWPLPVQAAPSRPLDLVPPPRVLHASYSTLDGLPTNNLLQIVLDDDGYLWIATWDGLVRFDGVRMITYRVSDTPELGSSRIGGLLVAGDGAVWIRNLYGGLCRYQNGRFEAVASEADAVTAMVEGPDGAVLYVGEAGLWRAAGPERQVVDPLVGLGRPVEKAVFDRNGFLWLADREHLATGLGDDQRIFGTGWVASLTPFREGVVFAREEASWGVATRDGWHPLPEPESDPGYADDVHASYVEALAAPAASDDMLLTIRGGEARIGTPDADRWVATLPETAARCPGPLSATGPDGSSWVAVGDQLLQDGRPVVDLDIESSPVSMRVDRHGAVWIATEADGLHVVRRARVSVLGKAQGLPGDNVTAVYGERSGAVWVGLRGGGVVRLGDRGPTPFLRPDGRPAEFANAFAEDSSGAIWVGLQGGLFRAEDGRLVRVRESGAPGAAAVVSLRKLPEGGLAVGTDDGLYLRNPTSDDPDAASIASWRSPDDLGVAAGRVRRIVPGDDGALWLATSLGVARRARNGDVRWLRRESGLPAEPVRGLHLDGRGVLWVGVEGRGLSRLDTRAWEATGEPAQTIEPGNGGLPDTIHQILEDRLGNLWMSSNRGLFKAALSDLDAVALGSKKELVTVRLDERDGMVDREANGTAGDSGFADDEGRLWFPTQGGVVVVDPGIVAARETPPRVVVEAVRAADGRVWSHDASNGEVVLTPRHRSFLVQFTAPDAAAPTDVSFRYRLEPFDDDWVQAGMRRQAIYASVPPGRYRFRVEARSGGGAWGGASEVLRFDVTPRIWETVWMRAALALALALGIGALWRLQLLRYRKRQEHLETVVARRTATIQEQARQVEELSGLRTRLFTNVSHELRTPLTLAIGPLQDLAASPVEELDETAREQVELALRSSRRLLGLADELLQVVRLEAGDVELSAHPVDLVAIASQAAERFRPLIEREGLRLRVELDPGGTEELAESIWADPAMLERILDNLLSNAVKFTDEGGITVRVGSDAEHAWFSVADTGRGMNPEDVESLFERYRKAGPRGRWSGFGIGLSMVRDLVELHGGRVRVTSSPGSGTVVRVELRRGTEHLDPRHVSDAHPSDDVSPSHGPTDAGEPSASEAPSSSPTPETPGSRRTEPAAVGDRPGVLLVEDDAEMRTYLSDCLADLYEVRTARHGRQALAKIREDLPDVVISDVAMPEMGGLELVQEVRADAETSFVPIILLTSRIEIADRLAGFQHGAEDYLGKPFDARELRARVQALLDSRRRLTLHLEIGTDASNGDGPWQRPTLARATPEERDFSRRLQGLMIEHLGEADLTVEDLAAAMHCDRTQLFRRVKQSLATTPSDLLRELRLHHARELLRQRAGNVSEVAYAVGFRNVSHFSQAFRKAHGATPSSVRGSG